MSPSLPKRQSPQIETFQKEGKGSPHRWQNGGKIFLSRPAHDSQMTSGYGNKVLQPQHRHGKRREKKEFRDCSALRNSKCSQKTRVDSLGRSGECDILREHPSRLIPVQRSSSDDSRTPFIHLEPLVGGLFSFLNPILF